MRSLCWLKCSQRGQDQLPLGLGHRGADAASTTDARSPARQRGVGRARRAWRVGSRQPSSGTIVVTPAVGHHVGALHDVAQLAHVARPAVGGQALRARRA